MLHHPEAIARRQLRPWAALVLAALALAACGGDDEAGSAVDASDLEGRTYVATTIDGAALVDGSSLMLTFADGRVAVTGGCNTSTGPFDVDDGVLLVGPLGQTMMACEPAALMEQDVWVGEFLESEPTVRGDGSHLTLASETISIDFDEGTAPS